MTGPSCAAASHSYLLGRKLVEELGDERSEGRDEWTDKEDLEEMEGRCEWARTVVGGEKDE